MKTEIDELSLKINIDGAEKTTADNINAIATAIDALNTAVSSSGALDSLAKYSAGLQKMAGSFQQAVAEMGKFSSSNLQKIKVPRGNGEGENDELPKAQKSMALVATNNQIQDATNENAEETEGILSSLGERIKEIEDRASELGGKLSYSIKQMADGTLQFVNKLEFVSNGFKKTETYVDGYIKSINKVPYVQKQAKKSVEETGKSVNKSTSVWSKFTKSIGRIAMYRAIRSVLKSITQAMTEGIQNYAKYSESANKSISNIKNSFQQVKDSFGVTLGYLLEAFEPIITTISDGVVKLAENINMALASMSGKSTYSKAIKQNEDYAKSLDKVNNKLLSFDKFESLNKGDDNNEPRYEEVELGDELPATAQAFKDIFDIIKEIISAVKKIIDRVMPLIQKILPSVKKIIEIILKLIDDLLPIIGDIVELVLDLLDPIIDLVSVIVEVLTPVIKVILDAIKKVLEFVVPILKWIIQFITLLVNAIQGKVKPLVDWFQNAIKNIRDWFVNLGNKIIEIGTKIKDFFVNLWHNIANGFASMINGIVNGFIKFVNILIDGLNLVLKPIDAIAGIFGGNVKIPHWEAHMDWKPYAKGGVPEVGTVFYAGEAGAEIVSTSRSGQTGVANVEQISQAMLQALINYNAAQNGQTGTGNVYLDGRQVGQLVESSVYREGVRVGHFKRA